MLATTTLARTTRSDQSCYFPGLSGVSRRLRGDTAQTTTSNAIRLTPASLFFEHRHSSTETHFATEINLGGLEEHSHTHTHDALQHIHGDSGRVGGVGAPRADVPGPEGEQPDHQRDVAVRHAVGVSMYVGPLGGFCPTPLSFGFEGNGRKARGHTNGETGGGIGTTKNRTYWPTAGGAVAFQPGWFQGHAQALLYVNLGLGTDGPDNGPPNMSLPMVPPFQLLGPSNSPYPGTVCLPQVPLPEGVEVKAGDEATIQVIELAQHGAALYSVRGPVSFNCHFPLFLNGGMQASCRRVSTRTDRAATVRRHHLRRARRPQDCGSKRVQLLQQPGARLRGRVHHHGARADPRRGVGGRERGCGGELLVPGKEPEPERVDMGRVGAGRRWRAMGVCLSGR